MIKTTTNTSSTSSRFDRKNSNITANTIIETEFEESSENSMENNTSLAKKTQSTAIVEQNDWLHNELTKLWGDNEAEYFVNPTIIQRDNNNNNNNNRSTNSYNRDENKNASALNMKRNQNIGLYAFEIWDSLRDETNSRLKNFELDKELQETMNSSINRKKISSSTELFHSNQEEEMLKNRRRLFDMNEIKRAKIFRNEIELMYRSSKMNQERVNMLRNSNPNPTTGGEFGLVESEREKNSVISYLPPMNLNFDNRQNKINSNQEFFPSPKLKPKNKKIITNQHESNQQSSHLALVEFNKGGNLFKKDNNHQIKLEFLTEKPFRSYLSSNRGADKVGVGSNYNHSQNIGASQTNHIENEHNAIQDNINQSIVEPSRHEKIRSLVLFDNNSNKKSTDSDKNNNSLDDNKTYPPLSMNALMEYKPSLLAPGAGEFINGRPKLFRQDIH